MEKEGDSMDKSAFCENMRFVKFANKYKNVLAICVIGFICFFVNNAKCETEHELWKEFFDYYEEMCTCDDLTKEIELQRKNTLIINKILNENPEDWLANYFAAECSIYCLDVGYVTNEKYYLYDYYFEKYRDLAADVRLDDIATYDLDERTRGMAYFVFAESIVDPVFVNGIIWPERAEMVEDALRAYHISYETLKDSILSVYPLEELLKLYLGLDGSSCLWLYGSDLEESQIYEDHTVCETVSFFLQEVGSYYNKPYVDSMLCDLRLLEAEANAFMAYRSYYENDWDGVKSEIDEIARILHEFEKLEDVYGKKPLAELYYEHICILYYSQKGDEEMLNKLSDQCEDTMQGLENSEYIKHMLITYKLWEVINDINMHVEDISQ